MMVLIVDHRSRFPDALPDSLWWKLVSVERSFLNSNEEFIFRIPNAPDTAF